MICSNCGQETGNGGFCVGCGTPVQQPQQQMDYGQPQQQMNYGQPQQQMDYGQPQQQMNYGQPQQQMNYGQPQQQVNYGQPQQQMNYGQPQSYGGGSVSLGSMDMMKIIGMAVGAIGALLVFLSPFFSWLTIKIEMFGEKYKETANLFKLEGIYMICALLIMAVGVVSVAVIVMDLIPPLMVIKQRIPVALVKFIGFIPAAAGIFLNVVVFIFMSIELSGDEYEMMKSYVGRGSGPVILLIGCLFTIAPVVMDMVSKNNKR